jgi:predicted transglutaminase-like cysteine proteinase
MVQSDPFTSIAALPDAAKTDRSFTLMPLFRAPADASPPAPAILLDERQMGALIAKINARVNHKVHQALDMRTYGRDDVWRPSGTGAGAVGDCEDLALEKRLQLIAAGFPPERLFMAIVFRPEVGLHAVLVARLPGGDRVLDSRVDYIQRWSQAGYAWLSLEQPGAPDRWALAA